MVCQSHEEIRNEISDIKKQLIVKVTNGKTYEKPINEAVGEIWEHTVFLRDLNRMHWFLKKYKIYRVVGLLMLLVMLFHLGVSIKDIILKILY